MHKSTWISQRLRTDREAIISQWLGRVRKEIRLSQTCTDLSIFVGEVLDRITTDFLVNSTDMLWDHYTCIGQMHGSERAHIVGYSVREIIAESYILRDVVFESLESQQVLNKFERDFIFKCIEKVIQSSASEFSETLKDIQEQFLVTLTHDLRSPLTVAKLSADLAARYPENEVKRQLAFTKIIESLERMDAMIADLLDARRLAAGQNLKLHFRENCNLTDLVEEAVQNISVLYGPRYKVEGQKGLQGYMSPSGIMRILENLLTNAAKYGFPGTPITISLSLEAGVLTVNVHNEGTPIPPIEQLTLFERFKRSKEANDKTGWGIGLTLVKGVIEAHKGSVSVQSDEQHGTNFTLNWPQDLRNLSTAEPIQAKSIQNHRN